MITFTLTQDTKSIITNPNDNVQYVDLIAKDIVYADNGTPPQGVSYFLVNEDTAMRCDLISKSMYGNYDHVEKILKFNGISNPFSIDNGDILIQWDVFSLERNMRSVNNDEQNKLDVRTQYLTPEKKSKVDPTLKEFNKRLAAKKTPDTALPPNYANFGDKEIELRNGVLVMGPNVSKGSNLNSGNDPLSKTQFINNLVKNRTNG